MGLARMIIISLGILFLSVNGGISEEVFWLWGKVVSLDKDNQKIKINYLDYLSSELPEKEEDFYYNKKTIFEDIENIEELRPGDHISIDYVVEDAKRIILKLDLDNPDEIIKASKNFITQEKKE